jgi:hypothetical protein
VRLAAILCDVEKGYLDDLAHALADLATTYSPAT